MPGTRLLVIADSKMLPALANGLRDGLRFDVLTVPLSDPAAALAAAEKADAVAVFYGAPGAPLPAALQSLSPKVRERGARVIAVLQREQAAHRDDCFRAGASDLLFMPMPKEQFVARMQASIELAWPGEAGAPVPVAVATRTVATRLPNASLSGFGVESPGDLPVKAGDTVRLSWGNFQAWGLVVRNGPSAQIRFAGLAPDEEAQIRDWLKAGAQLPEPKPSDTKPTPPGGSAAVAPSAPPPAPEARAAPASGPPPGFADRKPIRPQTRTPVRIPPPVMTSGSTRPPAPVPPPPPAAAPEPIPPAPVAAGASVAPPPPPPADAQPPPANGTQPPALAALFEEGAAAGAPGPDAPLGPAWPVPVPVAACKAAAMQLLKDKTVGADAPPAVAASARKVTGMLGSAERAALDKAGPDSHLADALAARIALDAATSEGVKLYSSSPAAVIDAPGVAALTKTGDEAAARLQKEANAAVGKGEVEALQMVTAASAALSRDMLAFKETADRLRGLSAAPRLGAGALDPDVVLPGQAPRPAAAKTGAPAPVVRAELRDFQNLEGNTARARKIVMFLAMAALVAAIVNAVYFSLPRRKVMSAEAAGAGVVRIEVSGQSALVTVTPEWLSHAEQNAAQLVGTLREGGVQKAIVLQANGTSGGLLDVRTGKFSAVSKPKK